MDCRCYISDQNEGSRLELIDVGRTKMLLQSQAGFAYKKRLKKSSYPFGGDDIHSYLLTSLSPVAR